MLTNFSFALVHGTFTPINLLFLWRSFVEVEKNEGKAHILFTPAKMQFYIIYKQQAFIP